MKKRFDYSTFDSVERGNSRVVKRYGANSRLSQSRAANRKYVPFPALDGQALAGTGALVFEGELINPSRK